MTPLPAMRRIGERIDRFPIVESTNGSAFEAAAAGAPDGTVIVADAQRAGRGRLCRHWSSPAGCNLYLSILLRGPFPQTVVTALPFLAAVATRDAIRDVIGEAAGVIVHIKWPNDLIINDRKVGGILVEARSAGGESLLAVVGIGLNVNWPSHAMPDELKATATSLEQELGRSLDRSGLLTAVLHRFDHGFGRLCKEGAMWLIDEWSRSCQTLGQTVDIETSSGSLTGLAEAVEPGGLLRLRHTDGSSSRLSVEATLRLRPSGPHSPITGVTRALRD